MTNKELSKAEKCTGLEKFILFLLLLMIAMSVLSYYLGVHTAIHRLTTFDYVLSRVAAFSQLALAMYWLFYMINKTNHES